MQIQTEVMVGIVCVGRRGAGEIRYGLSHNGNT